MKRPTEPGSMVNRPVSYGKTKGRVILADQTGVTVETLVVRTVPWLKVVPLCVGCFMPLDETSERVWPGACRNEGCFAFDGPKEEEAQVR